MKFGFLLTARLGSSRLPRKHLLEVSGQPLLEILIRRIAKEFRDDFASGAAQTVLVSSDEQENREFERFSPFGVHVFYGAQHNIPLRHLQAAEALDLDAMIAIDGDDILCSVDAMRVVQTHLSAGSDYVKTSGLPLGMNCMGYTRSFLASCMAGNESKVLETGWGYILDTSRLDERGMELEVGGPENLRFTLDYPEDYEFFAAIAGDLGESIVDASDQRIVSHVLDHGLNRLTDSISGEYWANFNADLAKEMELE